MSFLKKEASLCFSLSSAFACVVGKSFLTGAVALFLLSPGQLTFVGPLTLLMILSPLEVRVFLFLILVYFNVQKTKSTILTFI